MENDMTTTTVKTELQDKLAELSVEQRLELLQELTSAETEAMAAKEAAYTAAFKAGGEAHSRVVVDLYKLLGVAEEPKGFRVKGGRIIEVSGVAAERLRARRLHDIVVGLARGESLSSLQTADRNGLLERQAEANAKRATRQAELDKAAHGTGGSGTGTTTAAQPNRERDTATQPNRERDTATQPNRERDTAARSAAQQAAGAGR